MGKRGPRPQPTSVLKARGSRRAREDGAEPRPPAGIPACPDWIEPDAKRVWADTVAILDAMGVLTVADVNALTRYCQMFVQWRQAEEFIMKFGATYPIKSGNGVVKCFGQFPQVGIAQRLSLALTRLEQEFGLTPSARTRINVRPEFGMQPELSQFDIDFPMHTMSAEEARRQAEARRRFFERRAQASPPR